MQCHHFDAARCRSCALLGTAYDAQLAAKDRHSRDLVGQPGTQWLPPLASAESGFRNKAKMVVSGTSSQPVLGILDEAGRGVDLQDCGLYAPELQACLNELAAFVTRADLTPYDVPGRAGELKHVLVTMSPDAEVMVRFVLRSQEPVARIRKHLPSLLASLPRLRVVSVNLLPEHRAVMEGEREIVLTEQSALPMRVNGITLQLRPQSFFQTNTEIASALYRQVREWVDEREPSSVWDLYCGVGGFALHCAGDRAVTGVEVSVEAVASARLSAADAGLRGVTFVAEDATAFAVGSADAPELVIVNPPRRGLGQELSGWLERSSVPTVVYSSCSVESLARDLAQMPSLRPTRARVLDMFPHTEHYEVLTLLERV
jgi:23S rRNA (uracil747-C5)-methyltransferase